MGEDFLPPPGKAVSCDIHFSLDKLACDLRLAMLLWVRLLTFDLVFTYHTSRVYACANRNLVIEEKIFLPEKIHFLLLLREADGYLQTLVDVVHCKHTTC